MFRSQISQPRIQIIACFLLLTTIANWAGAQSWTNLGTGDWFTASNWNSSNVPSGAVTASINNGGHAMADAATATGPISVSFVDVGTNGGTGNLTTNGVNFELDGSLDLGDVEGAFATGAGVFVSSVGSATITDTFSVEFGLGGLGDINAGQTSASSGATAMGNGAITVERVTNLSVANDLDIGQTSGTGQATGNGTGVFRDITGAMTIGADVDVGQTSGDVGGNNDGFGMLTLERMASLSIAGDLDVGQTTGAGASAGSGIVSASDIADFVIDGGFDIGKVRSLNSATNSALGQASISDANLSVGFNAVSLGSIEIARVLVSDSSRGNGTGSLYLDQTDTIVANDVIVGELALGSTNANNSADASLTLVDSRIDTRDFSVASRLDNTVGTASGSVHLVRSLAIVQSILTLNEDSTLTIQIDGTTRALGDGLATDYSAIDADNAILGGALAIEDAAAYGGPSERGDVDAFELIKTLFGVSGAFDETTYNGVTVGATATYVGETNGGDDGLFASVGQTAMDYDLEVYLALPGDANGDRVVDGLDFIEWNARKFTTGNDWATGDFNGDGITDGLDFIIWNDNKFTSADQMFVPEPGFSLISVLILAACMVSWVRTVA